MREILESILIGSVVELSNGDEQIIINSFNNAVELLIQNARIFQELPEVVYISNDSLNNAEKKAGTNVGLAKDFATNFGENNEKTIKFFDSKAVLLHDGLHASAFGSMSYIYRSKGLRIYLFDNKEVKVVTPYCYIDHNGFQLDNELVDEIMVSDINKPDILRHYFSMFTEDFNAKDEKRFVCQDIIRILCNIKEPFHKNFYLEYLLIPPDADKLSVFSTEVRKMFWDICLSQDFFMRWGRDVQNVVMNILSITGITPAPNQLVAFIREKLNDGNAKLDTILERLSQLETNIITLVKESSASDISNMLELKPNIFGLGINGNEIYARLKEWWDKKTA